MGEAPIPETKVAVPSVVGENYERASAALEAVGLVPSARNGTSGTVRAESPTAGTQVEVGSTVTLTMTGVM